MQLERKKIPANPRFQYVTDTAYSLLADIGVREFPIDSFAFVDELPVEVKILRWRELRELFPYTTINGKKQKNNDPFFLKKQKAEAKSIYKDGKYFIVYDDTIDYRERINWTIMHEIGHIMLGHLVEFEEVELSRNGLTRAKYEVLEKEANYFAAEVLMPSVILKNFSDIESSEISLLFGVSMAAAERKHKRVFEKYVGGHRLAGTLYRNFYDFLSTKSELSCYLRYIEPETYYRTEYNELFYKCINCNSIIFREDKAEYCIFCGASFAEIKERPISFDGLLAGYSLKPKIHMKMPYFEVGGERNKFQRITVCPVCGNQEFNQNAKYCKICGSPIYSICTNRRCNFSKKPLFLNSKYCKNCGSETTMKNIYDDFEIKLTLIDSAYAYYLDKFEWVKYEFPIYYKQRLFYKENSEESKQIYAALYYSLIMFDENDKIHIIVFDNKNIKVVEQFKSKIISDLSLISGLLFNDLEVEKYDL